MDKGKELERLASKYWAAEAEVVRTYFSKPRTKERDVFWLKAQCYKEFAVLWKRYGVNEVGLVEAVAKNLPLLDDKITRHEYRELMKKTLEELNHYIALADILEWLSGRKVTSKKLIQIPEDKKLEEMRNRCLMEGDEVARNALVFTEGGGAALFMAGREIRGGEFEAKVSKALGEIYGDELEHYREGLRGLEKACRTEKDWERAKKIVLEISRQRVLMRNDMFGKPLSKKRIREIDEGKIEPLKLT